MQVSIQSASNPRIKDLLRIGQKSKYRKELGVVLVEGIRENSKALENGWQLADLFWCPSVLPNLPFDHIPTERITTLSVKAYEKLAIRVGVEGVIGLYRKRLNSLKELDPIKKFLVWLDGVEKPGNLGAIFRTSDGAGVEGVIVSDEGADVFSPNSIRASLGCIFSIPIFIAPRTEILSWNRRNKTNLVVASLNASKSHFEGDYSGSLVLSFGSEAFGVDKSVEQSSNNLVKIPMNGDADSLNVSVSAGIMIYEALRQRS